MSNKQLVHESGRDVQPLSAVNGSSSALGRSGTTMERLPSGSIVPRGKKTQPTSSSKKKKKRGMEPAAPATTVTRGFHTPLTSGGEESDMSAACSPRLVPSRSIASATQSPMMGPSALTRVLSNFHLQPEAMSREPSLPGSDISTPDSEAYSGPPTQKDHGSYEIPLVRDFASADTQPRPLNEFTRKFMELEKRDTPHRKMNATDFEQVKCLGKGAFGTVILVKQLSTGRLFAQKQLKKASLTVQSRLVEQAKTERQILESVNRHPFVVKLFYAFQDQAKLYLILEYAQGGELFHHLALERTFTEEVSAFYMAEMVLALEFLHTSLGVVYRDLKPENCLLDSHGHLLLTDFGLSKVALDDDGEKSRCNSVSGTIDYMAPEVVQGKSYDAVVDWWSLGALGYDLLTGSPPFSSNNHAKTEEKIVHGKLALPYYLSPDAKDFLTRLLRKEPRKRLGGNMPKDMAIIKGHRFFRRIDWKALADREVEAPIQPIITDPAAAENFGEEFTNLAMSPQESSLLGKSIDDNFTGFSYVAPSSLLERGLTSFM